MKNEEDKGCNKESFSDSEDSRVSDVDEEVQSEGELKEKRCLMLENEKLVEGCKRAK